MVPFILLTLVAALLSMAASVPSDDDRQRMGLPGVFYAIGKRSLKDEFRFLCVKYLKRYTIAKIFLCQRVLTKNKDEGILYFSMFYVLAFLQFYVFVNFCFFYFRFHQTL